MNFQPGTVHNRDLPAALDYHTKPRPISPWSLRYRVLKKLFDIGFSILALPLIALTAFALLLLNPFFNPGPLFFRQLRMGLGGRKFTLLKFRTMSVSSRNVRAHDDPVEDERITKFGKYLRRTRIDEWPNFFNVLKGEMSVVGPRPSPDDENQYCPAWRDVRLSVRPGITGLWQLKRRREPGEDFQEWIKYDIQYVQRASLKLDISIMLRTMVLMLTGRDSKCD